MRVYSWLGASVALTVLSSASLAGGITVPPGFAVDQLAPQLDGVSPRLEAIRFPAYGNGVMAASISGGILTVRRISLGNVETFAVVTGLSDNSVADLRFDGTGLFGNKLYVSVANDTQTTGLNRFIRVEPDGTTAVLGTIGAASDQLLMYLDFTAGAGGYVAGAYLYDSSGNQGSSVWTLEAPATFTRRAQDSVFPGRSDMDVNGMEFDRAGAFGGGLFLSEGDINQTGLSAIFRLSPTLVWTAFTPQMNFNTRYFRDLAISTAGAFGSFIYVTEAVGDAVGRVAPNAAYEVFATGFNIVSEYDNTLGGEGAASISVTEDGNTLYVSDANGVYRIRPTGIVPGPQVITQEPSAPSGLAICGPTGISSMRAIFNELVQFLPAHVVVRNSANVVVPSAVSGSGSAIMLIAFGTPIFNDTYTITLDDLIVNVANNAALDGDRNGVAGGDAILSLTHTVGGPSCPGDADGNGVVNFADITNVLTNFNMMCP